MYSLRRTPSRITAVLRGFWSPNDLAEFHRELGKALTHGGGQSGPDEVLIDCSDFAVQAGPLNEMARTMAAGIDKAPAIRIAFVAGTMLGRMQMERLFRHDRIGIFDDAVQAATWLDCESAGPAAHANARAGS